MLAHDDIGPERRGHAGDDRPDGVDPRSLARPRLEGHVEDAPGGRPLTDLVEEPAAGKQAPAGLMERDRHDPRIVGVDRLDTVPVVDVEVDVQHPLALEAGERDGQRRIVVDAEP